MKKLEKKIFSILKLRHYKLLSLLEKTAKNCSFLLKATHFSFYQRNLLQTSSAIFVAEVERAPYLLLAPWVNLARVAFLGGGSGPPRKATLVNHYDC